MKQLVIAVDYDQTCRAGNFPNVYHDIGAQKVLRRIAEAGHLIILYTLRCDRLDKIENDLGLEPINGLFLTEAINFFRENNIPLFGINSHPQQKQLTDSEKCWSDIFIDDRNLNSPLIYDKNISDEPFIDWVRVEELLVERGIL